jgi:hypothetical protein
MLLVLTVCSNLLACQLNTVSPPNPHPHSQQRNNTNSMAATPIPPLLSTWGNNNDQVNVEEVVSLDDLQIAQWPKAPVKARFKTARNEQHPILCPRLPVAGVPKRVAEVNRDRNNNVGNSTLPPRRPYVASSSCSWPKGFLLLQSLREVRDVLLRGRGRHSGSVGHEGAD